MGQCDYLITKCTDLLQAIHVQTEGYVEFVNNQCVFFLITFKVLNKY